MLKSILVLLALVSFSEAVFAQSSEYWNSQNLREDMNCLLQITRKRMGSTKTTPAPNLKIESETPLVEFQDAMEKWWNMRPDFFLNVYDANNNTIYLMNKKTSFKHPRTPMDSLVHELAHFVQVQDQGGGSGDADLLESEAVQVQTWFRENRGDKIQNEKYTGECE